MSNAKLNRLNTNTIFEVIQRLISDYDCYDLYFLDKCGKWQKKPETLREIISSELWFRVWSSLQSSDGRKYTLSLLKPILENENSQNLIAKFENVADILENNIHQTLAIFELLCAIVEYEVYSLNAKKYVPDWNYQEKKNQNEYRKKMEKFKTDLCKLLNDSGLFDAFFVLHNELKHNNLFESVCAIVSEETKIYEQLLAFRNQERQSKKTDDIYNLMSTNISLDVESTASRAQSLIRPLIMLLAENDFAISVDMQFQIVSLLGALKDSRCAGVLVNLLERTEFQNVNLISNIIYALGNVNYINLSEYITKILTLPDYIEVMPEKYKQPLNDIKCEAIWACGKLGISAKRLIEEIAKLKTSKDYVTKIALAWTMGRIGEEEKKEEGAVDAEILTTLLEFLNERNKRVFEESLYSLKKLGFFELIDSLNIKNIPATPILALKPSSIGLYELSETLYHLINLKKPVVIAVTGDSGTGKTYFCESIKHGFGDISQDDILYLMRDNPAHRTIFSRMIGLEFVKEFLDPHYYTVELIGEHKQTPSEFFNDFLKQNSNKKLIILDGWLDEIYFYQVLKTFYQFNFLDCVVNFRTTYSTRRINLETREGILERVKDCLRFVENPPIEETEFYRNGDVFVYNLDNSISSRLSSEEIKEVFSRRKVGSWADYIRIGRFEKEKRELLTEEDKVTGTTEKIMMDAGDNIDIEEHSIEIQTEHFLRTLNDNIINEPNLLQTIDFNKSSPQRISFFSPGVIAYTGKTGIIGLLTGINNKNHSTEIQEKNISGLCIHNDLICTMGIKSCMYVADFNKNRLLTLRTNAPPLSVIASDHQNTIVTGHQNGIITLWNMDSKQTKILNGHNNRVVGILISKGGKIVSADLNGELRVWNLREGVVKIYKDERFATEQINGNQYSGTIILVKEKSVFIINPMSDRMSKLTINGMDNIAAFCPYYDGRIFACFEKNGKGVLAVIEPNDGTWNYAIIGHQDEKTTDIVTMGSRIITTCKNCLHIWGSEPYVRAEIEKLKILKESRKPFYYHSMVF